MVSVELLEASSARSSIADSELIHASQTLIELESEGRLTPAESSPLIEFASEDGEDAQEEEIEEEDEELAAKKEKEWGEGEEEEGNEDETTEGTQESRDAFVPDSEDNTETENEMSSEEEEEASTPAKTSVRKEKSRSRRVTVFWTQEEVNFLRRGVRTRGVGHWKHILADGHGIFNEHRTNVDLKDKWLNLIKRYGEDEVRSEKPIEVVGRYERKRRDEGSSAEVLPTQQRHTRKKRRSTPAPSASDSEHSVEHVYGQEQEPEVLVEEVPIESDVDASQPVKVKIGSDYSFPNFTSVAINLTTCNTIEALKKRVRSKILPASMKELSLEQIEVVSIRTKRLLEDHEQLEKCLREDGRTLYVVT